MSSKKDELISHDQYSIQDENSETEAPYQKQITFLSNLSVLERKSEKLKQKDANRQKSIWYNLGIVKNDCGIFHLNDKYYKSRISIVATVVLIMVMFPLTYSEFDTFGDVIGQTEFYETIS